MKNPYEVLGVTQTATDEEIKKVYRELARKYHPDVYQNNPLADLAVEKMQEINDAYETITKMRKAGQSPNSTQYSNSYQGNPYQNGANPYAQVRMFLQTGQTVQAEQLLRTMPSQDAQWHFLMGVLFSQRGYLDQTRQCFQTAHEMEPNNPEYLNAYQQMQQNNGFGPNNGSSVSGGCCPCPCDCCTTFLCLNACCPCC